MGNRWAELDEAGRIWLLTVRLPFRDRLNYLRDVARRGGWRANQRRVTEAYEMGKWIDTRLSMANDVETFGPDPDVPESTLHQARAELAEQVRDDVRLIMLRLRQQTSDQHDDVDEYRELFTRRGDDATAQPIEPPRRRITALTAPHGPDAFGVPVAA